MPGSRSSSCLKTPCPLHLGGVARLPQQQRERSAFRAPLHMGTGRWSRLSPSDGWGAGEPRRRGSGTSTPAAGAACPASWLLAVTESVSQAVVSGVRGGGSGVWVCGMIWALVTEPSCSCPFQKLVRQSS